MDRKTNLASIIRYLMADDHVSHQIPSSLEERLLTMRALSNVWEPRPLSDEFLQRQDAELQLQRETKGVVTLRDVEAADVRHRAVDDVLLLWQGDITRLQVDAIVNAANAQALGCWSPLHNCIDNCIHSAAGLQLRRECAAIMQGRLLATGDAFITRGYNLPARHVIHTVGPIVPDGMPTRAQEEQLAQCYRSCLGLAEQHGLASIAFCCISTGVFRFPNRRAAEIAVETVRAFPRNTLKTVVFNVFLDKDRDIYQQLV